MPAEALYWIGEVLLGMEPPGCERPGPRVLRHLHGMGMLVRDLKTDNVVLSEDLGRGASGAVAKLTDFGLCKFGTEGTGDWPLEEA